MNARRLYWFALIMCLAMPLQSQAGGRHGGNSSGQSASSAPAHAAPAGMRSAARPTFNGGRMIAPGQRFSSSGSGFPSSVRRQHFAGSDPGAAINRRPVTSNGQTNRVHPTTNRSSEHSNFGRGNHVFAQHSANWHRDWDRHCDHFWHGHRCRFVNGSWFIFDLGFFPYDWYPYGYPYYAYGSYPYDYYAGNYDDGTGDYYGQGGSDSSGQYAADATISDVQARLRRHGYYRGAIDGVNGAQTRRALERFQRDHGLRATGTLTSGTLQALGLERVATN